MRRVLLVNPTITKARHARFPLAVMSLASALRGHADVRIIDGNLDRGYIASAVAAVQADPSALVGVSVMGGPQIPAAAAVSRAIRAASPSSPIVWGGYFPTICPDAAVSAPFVDYAIRGQGERSLLELQQVLAGGDRPEVGHIAGLSWLRGGEVVHNVDRPFSADTLADGPDYALLGDPARYLGRTYLGRRTAGHQAALGCRYRCTFCGVATLFRGRTALPAAARLDRDLTALRDLGADSIQFYDHNFFDREVDMVPLLEVLARHALPWWCYARADALLELSESSWSLVRRSRLRMAYIGAESPNDRMLHDIRKGTRVDQTLAAVERCRANGVVPELSFMLAPPQDPEGETERTFEFIRQVKQVHPGAEIILYVYTPLPPPPRVGAATASRPVAPIVDAAGRPVEFPASVDDWCRPEWVRYWCHADAPWLDGRLRRRIADFRTVLGCRFPSVSDIHASPWSKAALRALAAWRYRLRRYDRPWELDLSRRLARPHDPQASSL